MKGIVLGLFVAVAAMWVPSQDASATDFGIVQRQRIVQRPALFGRSVQRVRVVNPVVRQRVVVAQPIQVQRIRVAQPVQLLQVQPQVLQLRTYSQPLQLRSIQAVRGCSHCF